MSFVSLDCEDVRVSNLVKCRISNFIMVRKTGTKMAARHCLQQNIVRWIGFKWTQQLSEYESKPASLTIIRLTSAKCREQKCHSAIWIKWMSFGIVICKIPSITHYTLGGGTYFEIWINFCWLCLVTMVTSGTLLDSPFNCTFFLISFEKPMVMVVGLRNFILKESKVSFVVRSFVCCNIMRTQHYLW